MITSAALHSIVLGLAIVAYVVLTLTGHDGNPVFLWIGGQVSGAAIQGVSAAKKSASDNSPIQVAPSRSTLGSK